MTDIQVGPATDAERYLATDQTVWFAEVLSAPVEEQLLGIPVDQRFAAQVAEAAPETYPGIYGIFPMDLAIPGQEGGVRQVPCAGLTWVGVHPDHRRRGILTAMLRHHFEQVHAEPRTHVSALHASEPSIYGRHGYGLASLELVMTVPRGATLSAPGLDEAAGAVTTQLTTATDPGIPERSGPATRRTPGWATSWARRATTSGSASSSRSTCVAGSPWRVLFARRDGVEVGFAAFRRNEKWEHARPASTLEAWVVVGETATRLALARRLVDFDLVSTISFANTGVGDPLLHWAGGPRATDGIETYDSLWVRLVDLPEALSDRSWSAPCDVVVDVTDRPAPWNEGRWRICADVSGRPPSADHGRRRPAPLGRRARRGVPGRHEPGRARPSRADHRAAERRGPRAVPRAAHRHGTRRRRRVLIGVLAGVLVGVWSVSWSVSWSACCCTRVGRNVSVIELSKGQEIPVVAADGTPPRRLRVGVGWDRASGAGALSGSGARGRPTST